MIKPDLQLCRDRSQVQSRTSHFCVVANDGPDLKCLTVILYLKYGIRQILPCKLWFEYNKGSLFLWRITCSVWLVCHGVMCRPRSEVFRNGLPYRVLLEAPHPSAPALQHFSVFNPLQIPTSGHRCIFSILASSPYNYFTARFPWVLSLTWFKEGLSQGERRQSNIWKIYTSKKHRFIWRAANQWPLFGETLFSSVPPSNSLV